MAKVAGALVFGLYKGKYQVVMFRIYSTSEKLVAGLLSLALSVCVCVYIAAQSMEINKKGFEIEAQSAINQVRSGLDVVDGVATSLRALPFSKLDPSRVSSYSRTIIGDYGFITGFGRFENVPEMWLDGFVEGMRKLPRTNDYTLWQLGSNQQRVARSANQAERSQAESRSWYPVTLTARQSKDSNTVSLEGLDIGSIKSLESSIREATVSGNTTLTQVPPLWQKTDHVLALRTSYGTQLLPETVSERLANSDGGYWLALDMNQLGVADGENSSFGLSLSMFDTATEFDATAKSEILYQRDPEATELLLTGWFPNNEWISSFSVGEQTILLRALRPRGLTREALFSSLLCALLVLIFAAVILVLNGKRRYEKRLQEHRTEQLYREQHRASVTLASIGDAVITTDVAALVQYANHAAENMLGLKSSEIRGKSVELLPVFGNPPELRARGEKCEPLDFQNDVSVNTDRSLVGPDGMTLYVSQTISPLLDINGERSGNVIVLRDVSAEKELTRTLVHRINHDALTGLANRVQFENCLTQLFENCSGNESHAICYIDLDRFKQINDTCGHAAGDRLLVELSAAMQSKVRTEDVLARLGGDEFGIVLRHCEPEAAESVVRRIHSLFSDFSFEDSGRLFPVRGSIGLVNFKPLQTSIEDVLNIADAACYAAKSNGSNSIHINSAHEADVASANVEELWVPRIQGALEKGGFELHVQPIAAIGETHHSLAATHHEFLLRMTGRDGQLVYPGNFIKPAERCGLMGEIDRWVIEHSLGCIASLPPPMSEHIYSINLSGQAIKSSDLFSFIAHKIAVSGVHPSQLCFEVNEGEMLNNFEAATALFEKLRGFGCKVALDDFGAGLSSFSGLIQLPVDFIKIDEKILAGISTSGSSRQLLRAIADFASSIGTQTIAEKVEAMESVDILVECRINFAQGYAIGRPQPLKAAGEMGASSVA